MFSSIATPVQALRRHVPTFSSFASRVLLPLVILGGLFSVSSAVLLPQDTLKISPTSVTGSDPDVTRLFDRDTTTVYSPQSGQQISVALDGRTEIRSLRIFGAAPYLMSVHASTGNTWHPISGLQNIDLTQLPEAWNTFALQRPDTASSLRIDLTPAAGSASAGLKEIEIWGAATRSFIANPQQLLTALNSQTPPLQGKLYAAAQQQGTIGDNGTTPDDTSDNSFTLDINRNPADFKRAWLVYESKGLSHWSAGVRAINGNAPQGGLLLSVSDTWATQIEEINSAWLKQGANRVDFATNETGAYTVRNVRLMAELEDGTNFVLRVESSGGGATAAYDGDVATGWAPYATGNVINGVATLDAYFDKPTQVSGLRLNMAGSLAGTVRIAFLSNGTWAESNYTALNAATLAAGWNDLNYPSSFAVDAVRLSFQGGTSNTGDVRELMVSGSGAGHQQDYPALHVTYPDNGQFMGREAYIRGFVTPLDNGSGLARLYVAGQEVTHTDGAYGVTVSKDEIGLTAQADSDPWSVEVRAVYGDGSEVRRVVQLNRYSQPAVTIGKDGLSTYFAKVPPGKERKLAYSGAELLIGTDALDKEVTFGMTPLRHEDLPRLDTGMTNVTKGPPKGYRFTPHGAHFKNKIKVVLPFDRNSIPPGHTEQDVHTYYFDEQAGSWKLLERAQIDVQKGVIVSYTDHFTDMINATITVPDHPNPASLNPTSIKDIKAADPGAQINLIEPPKTNNMGDARVSYPIELPPGRNGMQPGLAVQYNSAGGNGWMGQGWDIAMQSVSIDTRWGVPRYDAALETETYVLDGEPLTPVAHRGELKPRTAEKTFHTRIEGQFRRIVRHGNAPAGYWWEVTDKNGMRFFYGGRPESGLDQNAVLADPGNGNVFRWALKEVRDTNGNNIVYQYDVVNGGAGGEPWRQIYLKRINYTGSQGAQGPYEVTFSRAGGRTDVIVDGRPGFKTVMDQRLTGIDVSLASEASPLIRRYSFDYVTAAFKKTLLTRVMQYGEDGRTEFNHHRFDYYDEARDNAGNYNGFSAPTDWSIGHDSISAGLLGKGLASALGGSRSESVGGHLYVGVGSGSPTTKQVSGGVKVGYSRSKSETLIAMADMNGDGLPDKVFKGGGGFHYRPNLSGPRGTPAFGEPVALSSLPAISREKVTSTTVGAEVYFGLPVMVDRNRSINESNTYFSDVNGDGLTDLVSGGRVLFGYVNGAGTPTFSANSADTPVAIGNSAVDTNGLLNDASEIEAERAAAFPLLDTVRLWVAPYDGVVQINAPVHLLKNTSEERANYDGADGVRVAIQLEGAELWATSIAADDYTTHTPAGVAAVPVRRGDKLYFRVQSVFDGAFDNVAWDARISYLNVNAARTDVNALPVFIYGAAQDFALAGRSGTVTVPLNGRLHLAGTLEKSGATTDDVTVSITRNNSEIYRRTVGFADTAVVDIAQDLDVLEGEVLGWRVLVDSPIDATRVRLSPVAYYTAAQGVDQVTDEQGNHVLRLQAAYSMDVYPVTNQTTPQDGYVAPSTGALPVQASVQINGLAAGQKTYAVLTVKRRGALLGKRLLEFTGTGSSIVQDVTIDVPVTAGDELFFDLSSRDVSFPALLAKLEVKVGATVVPAALHAPAPDGLFANQYRGWGGFGYNGNGERASRPIDQSVLVLSDKYDPNDARVYPFMPRTADYALAGPDDATWIKAAEISASRLGLDDIRMPRAGQYAGASAVPRISESVNNSVSIGITGSKGSSHSKLDFMDLNGDRYPDVLGQGGVQYTSMTGPLEPNRRSVGLGSARESENETYGASTSGAGNIARAIAAARGHVVGDGSKNAMTAQQGMDMPALGGSADIGVGTSEVQHDLIDINGDGLPDKVYKDGNVALNLGYRFAVAEQWGGGIVNDGKSMNAGGGINLGYQKDFYSWGGGLSLTIGKSESDESYVDINGDGLPDKVVAGDPFKVRLNTGAGFAEQMAWPVRQDGKVAIDKHISLNGGAYFSFGFTFFGAVKIVFNPGVNASTSMGRPEVAFRDVDGDGYADYVFSDKDSKLNVGGNAIGRTNLLKRITRPLGATIDLTYTRDGNTYNQPHSKWVLTKTAIHDGHPGDGVDMLVTTFAYEDGYYDRAERDFYGYSKVIETQRDITRGEAAYRRNISEYHNRDYYTKGLLARSVLEDSAGRTFKENKNQYAKVVVGDGAALPGDEARTATVFPQLTRTDSAWYEGQPGAGKQTYTTHKYDTFGNVVEFFDAGDIGADDDVKAAISYTQDTANYIVGKPTRIEVIGAGRLMRAREANYAPGTGNLVQVRQLLDNGQAAVTDLAYNPNGTIKAVTGPVNHRGQRYALDYSYDPVVATHITGIVDSFGLSSTATYNFKYGKVTSTIDTNGNATETAYDTVGRTIAITGPYQTGTGDATLRFEYHPEAATPWARTRHLDVFRNAADTIDTVLFTDGIKRVLQTKKDIALYTGPTTAPVDVMSVSGRIVYDAFGRAVAQYYPVTESLGNAGTFNEAVDTIAPTRTDYDVLDRVTKTLLPDNTFTTLDYGFGGDRHGLLQFQTVVTDANGKRKVSYRDVQEQITAVQEFNQGQTIWTSYVYDPLKQIVEVKDDRGHLTSAQYDNLGRRIALDNPDTGLTTSEFDLAGNLTGKVTANLRAEHKSIRYTYDYGRLSKVNYPNFPGNDIAYAYGAPRAPYNRAGRIVTVTDQSGSEERFYGKLGEVVKETRTIASDTQGNSANSPEVWTTEYLFDTFGRLQRMQYPDGEVLSYAYDSGGNLMFAQGMKAGALFNYLTRLEYDKFEQRVYLAYGNGIRTQYAYNAQNRRLSSLQSGGQGRTLQNLAYRYDNVGNILGLNNRVPVPPANSFGGPTAQSFGYDDLYRLTKAEGSYDFAPNKRDRYSLAMAYDTIHNITAKVQNHEIVVPGGQAIEQKKTTYDWSYEYASTHPHAVTHLGERSYRYDASGNQTGWDHDRNGTRRNIIWDDENRIQSIFDNGHEKAYKYDDEGNRVIKRGPQGETVYVNQWFTVRNREVASKHVYAGTTRIATALVPGVKPAGSGMGTTVPSTGTPTGTQPRGILQAMGLQQRSAVAAQRARNLERNPHYATGVPGTTPGTATNQDNFLYFYHPDHLGSSSYVTDVNGKPYEHLEYFPFGETWVQESSNTQRTPYLFTGKELDEETGLYYYGARYYDPRTSVWQSPDPILAKYLPTGDRKTDMHLPGMGGAFTSFNLNLYAYGHQRPVILTDPDGRSVWTKVAKFIIKGGDKAATFGDLAEAAAVILNPASTPVQKALAAAEIASEVLPVSVGDAKDAWKLGRQAYDKLKVSSGGRRGNQATRDQLDNVRDKFLEKNPDHKHVAGGRDQATGAQVPEEYIPGPGGARKGSSYPDLTFEGPDGSRIRINTVDVRKDGTMTPREEANFERIFDQTKEPIIAVPKVTE